MSELKNINDIIAKYKFLQVGPDGGRNKNGFIYDLKIFGIEIPQGWNNLFDLLCQFIGDFIGEDNIFVSQIKEKWGELRFYYQLSGDFSKKQTEIIDNFIAEFTILSQITCAVCGEPGYIRNELGWLTPYCDEHFYLEKIKVKNFDKKYKNGWKK
jgi:hypothetical protein